MLIIARKEKEEQELEVDEQIFEENSKKEITTQSLLNQVYDKYTEVEQMSIVEKTLENDERECIKGKEKELDFEKEFEI